MVLSFYNCPNSSPDFSGGAAIISRYVVLIPLFLVLSSSAFSEPIKIGASAIVPENPRSQYSRFVNWRPADGEVVTLNPPRMSWPYTPNWPVAWTDEYPQEFRDRMPTLAGYRFYTGDPDHEEGVL